MPRVKSPSQTANKLDKKQRGEKLAAMRKSLGLGQAEVGALLGADQPYISRLEGGINDVAKIGTARSALLASILQIDIQDYFHELGIGAPRTAQQIKKQSSVATTMRFGGNIGAADNTAEQEQWNNVSTDAWRITGRQYLVKKTGGDIANIQNGDTVYGDPSDRDLQDGKIYVVRPSDTKIKILRRLKQFGRNWMFVSDDPNAAVLQKRDVEILARLYWHEPKPRSL